MELFLGDDGKCTPEERMCQPDHRGFSDTHYTPRSKAAGRIRTLVAGMTYGGVSIFGDCIVRCMGYTAVVTKEVVAMVSKWAEYCEPEMPTLHVFRRKKCKNFEMVGPYVGSMCVYNSDAISYLGVDFPDPGPRPGPDGLAQQADDPALQVRHRAQDRVGGWDNEAGIVRDMTTKGRGDDEDPGHERPDPSRPSLASILMSKPNEEEKIVIPGRNMMTAFINMQQNTEDATTGERFRPNIIVSTKKPQPRDRKPGEGDEHVHQHAQAQPQSSTTRPRPSTPGSVTRGSHKGGTRRSVGYRAAAALNDDCRGFRGARRSALWSSRPRQRLGLLLMFLASRSYTVIARTPKPLPSDGLGETLGRQDVRVRRNPPRCCNDGKEGSR
ncbi:hypothetical protein MAPG_10574 [Magnaporthiopsis poae ATCC 64411]|uniref:Uncharacterized protein n=1 Tax=Magnaporthiopsis poae (strain ATCC 64411 / 73-15) TaxID=644358 RepID=A0A0C4ECY5_MAGP6|nr:hypothetical protein MAPG_10574 [Magnaporthiopsis poae ATCC 64411]